MAKRLSENLTSLYLGAAQRLKPKTARRKIVVYVESYDDVFFWRTVLDDFEDDSRYFEIMLPSRSTLGKGGRGYGNARNCRTFEISCRAEHPSMDGHFRLAI